MCLFLKDKPGPLLEGEVPDAVGGGVGVHPLHLQVREADGSYIKKFDTLYIVACDQYVNI
jgi:hypothetical protein